MPDECTKQNNFKIMTLQSFSALLLAIAFSIIALALWFVNKKEQHNPKPVDRFEYEQNLSNAGGRSITFYSAIVLSTTSLMLWITFAVSMFNK